MPETTAGETCANCDTPIGRLETPHIWRDKIVCPACYARLGGATAVAPLEYARPIAKAESLLPNQIICPNPNCGYVGEPLRKRKGSVLMLIVLLILWVLPGIIYAIVYNGYTINCPRCGVKIRDE